MRLNLLKKFILTEYDRGTFGQSCIKGCGNCVHNEQCHHINGSCINGCDPGYDGTQCTTSTSKICTGYSIYSNYIQHSSY